MRKIRLEIENLSVESFDTAADPSAGRGTVHGHHTHLDLSCEGSCFQTNCGAECTYDHGCTQAGGCGGQTGTCPPPWSADGVCPSLNQYSGCDMSCEFPC